MYLGLHPQSFNATMHIHTCTIITFTSKAPPRDLYPMYPMVHQGKLVVLRGTPSKDRGTGDCRLLDQRKKIQSRACAY